MMKCPNKLILSTYLIASLRLTIVFVIIYGGCNWLAMQRENTFQLWMNWELAIPLIPWMIVFYMSLNILLLLPLFTLSQQQILKLERSLITITMVAGAFFLFMPAHIGYDRSLDVGEWRPFYVTLFSLDHTANTFPSLHIAYSFLAVRWMTSIGSARWNLILWPWFLAICASVLLVHQHHVVDIVGGILFAEMTFRWPVKWPLKLQASSSP